MTQPPDPFATPDEPPAQPQAGYPPVQPQGGYPPVQPQGGYPPVQPQGGYPPPPPPGYGPPAYPPPPPGYAFPQPYQTVAKTNTMAIIALVAIFTCAPAALIFGIIARNQIKQTHEQGAGMALAGIIVGGVCVAFLALLVVLFIIGIAVGGGSTSY